MTRKCRGRLRRRCRTRQVKLLNRLWALCRISLPVGGVWRHYFREVDPVAGAPEPRTDPGDGRSR